MARERSASRHEPGCMPTGMSPRQRVLLATASSAAEREPLSARACTSNHASANAPSSAEQKRKAQRQLWQPSTPQEDSSAMWKAQQPALKLEPSLQAVQHEQAVAVAKKQRPAKVPPRQDAHLDSAASTAQNMPTLTDTRSVDSALSSDESTSSFLSSASSAVQTRAGASAVSADDAQEPQSRLARGTRSPRRVRRSMSRMRRCRQPSAPRTCSYCRRLVESVVHIRCAEYVPASLFVQRTALMGSKRDAKRARSRANKAVQIPSFGGKMGASASASTNNASRKNSVPTVEEASSAEQGVTRLCGVRLCLDCFSVGAEVFPHRADHAYAIVDVLDCSVLLDSDWTGDEEVRLLDAVARFGIGSWAEVSKYVGTWGRSECKTHYQNVYLIGLDLACGFPANSTYPGILEQVQQQEQQLQPQRQPASEHRSGHRVMEQIHSNDPSDVAAPRINPTNVTTEVFDSSPKNVMNSSEITGNNIIPPAIGGQDGPAAASEHADERGDHGAARDPGGESEHAKHVNERSDSPLRQRLSMRASRADRDPSARSRRKRKRAAAAGIGSDDYAGKPSAASAGVGGHGTQSSGDQLAAPAALSGFMPKRHDFEHEFDDDAEALLADLEICETDTLADVELKVRLIELYNARLDEREARKEFVLDRGLLEFDRMRAEERRRPKGDREFVQQLRVFSRLHSEQEQAVFENAMTYEHQLLKRASEIAHYRSLGIRTWDEASVYLFDLRKRTSEQQLRAAKEPLYNTTHRKNSQRGFRYLNRDVLGGPGSPSAVTTPPRISSLNARSSADVAWGAIERDPLDLSSVPGAVQEAQGQALAETAALEPFAQVEHQSVSRDGALPCAQVAKSELANENAPDDRCARSEAENVAPLELYEQPTPQEPKRSPIEPRMDRLVLTSALSPTEADVSSLFQISREMMLAMKGYLVRDFEAGGAGFAVPDAVNSQSTTVFSSANELPDPSSVRLVSMRIDAGDAAPATSKAVGAAKPEASVGEGFNVVNVGKDEPKPACRSPWEDRRGRPAAPDGGKPVEESADASHKKCGGESQAPSETPGPDQGSGSEDGSKVEAMAVNDLVPTPGMAARRHGAVTGPSVIFLESNVKFCGANCERRIA
ncbi:Transcriptional adapter ADA2 [Porphyridium purpureum]|uniref:Transcriptional adapter ADA2 n=1 Tax=Porphyridium purpureum TaxID=35688 RepID=A0A5J4Z777_PORPP|nr:Transcriptional adapter ADA2 [Porphyridium purpureum]|eukprot:POR3858..scf295_1